MQTTVDLPEPQLEALHGLAKAATRPPPSSSPKFSTGLLTPEPVWAAEPLSWETWTA